jgi:hypothetical protein
VGASTTTKSLVVGDVPICRGSEPIVQVSFFTVIPRRSLRYARAHVTRSLMSLLGAAIVDGFVVRDLAVRT